jgi:hypothetical protein
LNCPGATRSVVPDTFADIWSIPDISIDLAGQEAKYADMGGWWDTCSVRYIMRTASAGGEVRGVVELGVRLRLDTCAARLSSSVSCCGDVGAVDGLRVLRLEKALMPLVVLFELLPLLTLPVSTQGSSGMFWVSSGSSGV